MIDPRFLLDSNICIYILAGVGDALRHRLEACSVGEIAVSSISFAEVMRGVAFDDTPLQRRATAMFQRFEILPFGAKAGESYRDVPFRRHRFDRLIAAHALSLDLTLVTNNTGDFADIVGLKVENWTQ